VAKVGILCLGDEGYGIQRVVLDLVSGIPQTELLVLREGSLFAAAKKRNLRVSVVGVFELKDVYRLTPGGLFTRRAELKARVRQLRDYLLQRRISVVHTHILPLHLLAGWACKRSSQIRCVWHFHVICGKNRFGFLTRLLHKVAGLLWADRIIAVSRATARPYYTIFGRHVRVIYNGISQPPAFDRAKASALRARLHSRYKTVLCWAGRLVFSKGLHVALQALAYMDNPELGLIVLGDTDDPALREKGYKDLLSELVEKNNLADQVEFVGQTEDVLEYMAAGDIVVHTRLDAEPCSMVIIEAMSMGRPVVATRTGGTSELIEHGVEGLLVPPGSPVMLAKALKTLLDNKKTMEELGQRAQAKARTRFSVDRVCREVEQIYAELYSRK